MASRRLLCLSASLFIASVALAGCTGLSSPVPQVREMTFWVEPMDWEIAPGVTTTVWAFCGEGDGVEPVHDGACGVPGPTVHVTKGDTIRLTFQNTHSIPHTIHFHGWHPFATDMNGNGLVDGAMVVDPGETQTIEWTAEPSGSFIYHCHFETPTHMEMGMYGAFIVDDPDQPDVDQDVVAVLDEWQIRDQPEFDGNIPAYNFFTINGKSFPLTQPIFADVGETVRIHMVNAGYEFHAMHLHGYTPLGYEGVAGPDAGVLTDVREIAPGQTVVLDFSADREGVWLFHDHVVPRVTAASDGHGFGAYPRGMLTVLAVGKAYQDALLDLVPDLIEAAEMDTMDPEAAHAGHDHGAETDGTPDTHDEGTEVHTDMKDFAFQDPTLEVEAGTTVTWVNQDAAYHTVTFEDGSVDSLEIQPGETWSYTFTEPGTYDYYCKPHSYEDDNGDRQGMTGTVVVT